MNAALQLARWSLAALGQLFLPHGPSKHCEPCGKRRPVAHFDVERGRNGAYWS